MNRPEESLELKRNLYFGSSGSEDEMFFAVYENDELVEYKPLDYRSPKQGDIYFGKAGDYFKNNSSLFVSLSSQKGSSVRGYLRSDSYRPGDNVLVQVVAQATESKICRLTDRPSIAGKYIVLVINDNTPGVKISSKITSPSERERLFETGSDLLSDISNSTDTDPSLQNICIIFRTNAENIPDSIIENEFNVLFKEASSLLDRFHKAGKGTAPFIMKSADPVEKALLEYPLCSISGIYTDSSTASKIKSFVSDNDIDVNNAGNDIFNVMKVNRDFSRLSGRTVELRSGGNIVIDPTEALTVFDVNSGSFIRAGSRRELILNTNLEAAAEIARQLRLRSITGVAVCDFINMENNEDKQAVISFMESFFTRDPANVEIYGFTKSGLLEIVRSRGINA